MQYLGFMLLIFIALEIFSIAIVAKAIGGLAVFALIILCFMAGSFLMKRSAGLSQLLMAGGLFKSGGRISLYQMLYPIRIPFAAFLLMFPGFFSDLIALIVLLPFGGHSATHTTTQQQSGHFGGFTYHTYQQNTRQDAYDDDVIEGDFVVRNDKKQPEKSRRHSDFIEHQKD
ncbi:FxsA family protein [Wielerella bovis]|uniref:FxsA family protein n=1 Tax=Wielerella bovis TaxID=2917790 RepID=UPI002018754D|nr:FxsA family protein [Wielerella bovis]ULJ68581.1 FxsA family protein [Wielerella bovis]